MRNYISNELLDDAIKDPEQHYDAPEDVLNDRCLNKKQKQKILESWALDQEALLRAEGENMEPDVNDCRADVMIQKINKIKEKLQ